MAKKMLQEFCIIKTYFLYLRLLKLDLLIGVLRKLENLLLENTMKKA